VTDLSGAWSSFCDRLRDLGTGMLDHPQVTTDRARAETLRYLTRELRVALEGGIEAADPMFPQLQRIDESGSGPTAPNIDNWYLMAKLDGTQSYRLTGRLNTVFDVNISVHAADDFRVIEERYKDDLQLDEYGRFELGFGGKEVGRDGVSLPAGAATLFIRVYFYDWENEAPPSLALTRIGCDAETPQTLDWNGMSERLAGIAGRLEQGKRGGWPAKLLSLLSQHPTNTVAPPFPLAGGGLNIQYGGAVISIGEDEAVVVEVGPPPCRYYGFHLYTIPWFEPIDLSNRITALNGKQVHVDDDGMVRIVIAHRDPGVQNWLDVAGLPIAAFFYRWIRADASPTPIATLMPLADVPSALPAATPRFELSQRRDQIARRRAFLASRFRY
jgi:hypothetical protein